MTFTQRLAARYLESHGYDIADPTQGDVVVNPALGYVVVHPTDILRMRADGLAVCDRFALVSLDRLAQLAGPDDHVVPCNWVVGPPGSRLMPPQQPPAPGRYEPRRVGSKGKQIPPRVVMRAGPDGVSFAADGGLHEVSLASWYAWVASVQARRVVEVGVEA